MAFHSLTSGLPRVLRKLHLVRPPVLQITMGRTMAREGMVLLTVVEVPAVHMDQIMTAAAVAPRVTAAATIRGMPLAPPTRGLRLVRLAHRRKRSL